MLLYLGIYPNFRMRLAGAPAALNVSRIDLCFIIFSDELPDRPPGQSFPPHTPCTSG